MEDTAGVVPVTIVSAVTTAAEALADTEAVVVVDTVPEADPEVTEPVVRVAEAVIARAVAQEVAGSAMAAVPADRHEAPRG